MSYYNCRYICGISQPWNRRALCQLAIFRPQKAVTDLKKVLALEPQNKLARTQLEATQKLIRKVEFEKASTVLQETAKCMA